MPTPEETFQQAIEQLGSSLNVALQYLQNDRDRDIAIDELKKAIKAAEIVAIVKGGAK